MIDHIGIAASRLQQSKDFYSAALKPLGIGLLAEFPAELTGKTDVAGFGLADGSGGPEFWLSEGKPGSPVHVGFLAEDRAAVDAFYAAAIAAGGKDNGPPGPRPHYHEHYYAAFVLDPDGHNVEAMCRKVP